MKESTMASVRRRRTIRSTLAGSVGVLAVVLTSLFAMPGASADIPAVDEIVHSPNIKHLANIPKQPPFNTTAAFGTDIAFQGRYAFVGNYEGFVIYDISRPKTPQIVSQVSCPGPQNDVSVAGNLLFLSTDDSRNNDSCQSTRQSATIKESWEGIKIFDISDVRNPRYVKSVETKCGSHTHTLVPGARGTVYVYVSSFFPALTLPDCQPPHDLISIIKVPLRNPAAAALVAEPNVFPNGGNPGIPPQTWFPTSGCHDLTAFPAKDLMAGACMGDGVLFDISRPEEPRVLDVVQDNENFAFWHSATFSLRANKIIFTDELGGGGTATCTPATKSTFGANAIYDVVRKGGELELAFRSYYKIPRQQADTENCVAHNGSLIPVRGRDIMVQSWYQGGVSVWDFTDSRAPKEIGFFERGPLSATQLILGGTWSAYYYNGHVYSSDIQKGLDVLKINDRRTDAASRVRLDELNAQTQPTYRR
jgi:hypothetical protein